VTGTGRAPAAPPAVRLAASPAERAACIALRFRVFVDEQRVPPEEEVDAHDAAAPFLVALGPAPAAPAGEPSVLGTARVVFIDGGACAKIGRVAVERAERGRGIGLALVAEAVALAARHGAREAVLDAQVPALDFYARLGFRAEGPEFLDCNIPHRRMRRVL